MKKLLPLVLGCLVAAVVLAQDFWLSPQRFYYTIRDIASIRFLMGENLDAKDWPVDSKRIEHLVLYTPGGMVKDLILPTDHTGSLQLPLGEEGTHMVVCSGASTAASWEANDFETYLEREGLDEVNRFRRQHHEERSKGKAYVQYDTKTIFQVGGKITDDCLHPSLLPLDIIPEENPYAVQERTSSDKLVKKRFQVIFDGQPLYNTLVKIWYRGSGNAVQLDSARTNRRGWVSIDRHGGQTLLTTAHIERNKPDTGIQWQAYHTSLSFEYPRSFSGKTGR